MYTVRRGEQRGNKTIYATDADRRDSTVKLSRVGAAVCIGLNATR